MMGLIDFFYSIDTSCTIDQVKVDNGICKPCAVGEVPSQDKITCELCPNDSAETNPGNCTLCVDGEVPNQAKTDYKVCCNGYAETSPGICTKCAPGEVPAFNQTTCIKGLSSYIYFKIGTKLLKFIEI